MKSIISMRSLCVAAVAAISASNLFLASCNGEDDYEMNGEYTLAEGRMTRGNDAGIGSGSESVSSTWTNSYSFIHIEDDSTKNDTITTNVTLTVCYYGYGSNMNSISATDKDRNFPSLGLYGKPIFTKQGAVRYSAKLIGTKNNNNYMCDIEGNLIQ